jgi:transposase InsO family protein
VALARLWTDWHSSLALVQPETVIRWHRKGFKLFWRWKSWTHERGRPPVNSEIISLIRRMSQENHTWGAPRIQSELRLLGHDVAESTVAKYMTRRRRGPPSQSWRTFLKNHLGSTVACDFFVVPTATFRLLFCFLVLAHDRRRIVHFNVTLHPSAEWTAQQLIEAFPGDEPLPRYLLRDRDSTYSAYFRSRVKGMGIQEVITARKSPWQNPYAERVIGSIRRECLDHVIVFDDKHLRCVLRQYFVYYNNCRPHLSLDGNAPVRREVEPVSNGRVIGIPKVGGLHHYYTRAA